MRTMDVIGIGAGDPKQVTHAAAAAIGALTTVIILDKGDRARDLRQVRDQLLTTYANPHCQVVTIDDPQRDRQPAAYRQEVEQWHHERAAALVAVLRALDPDARVGILVWGDPNLYDSTLRLLDLVVAQGIELQVQVYPGITAIQALTAAFGVVLNTIGGAVLTTTGRRLRTEGWPREADTVAVMLDAGFAAGDLLKAESSVLPAERPEPQGPGRHWAPFAQAHVWWGAYLGLPQQTLIQGELGGVAAAIVERRDHLRQEHGWIMDTYLIRRPILDN